MNNLRQPAVRAAIWRCPCDKQRLRLRRTTESTSQGRAKHCNEIGMIVHVSHCGHVTTMDACRHSSKPVTANHTPARSVFPMRAAKATKWLRTIADTAG